MVQSAILALLMSLLLPGGAAARGARAGHVVASGTRDHVHLTLVLRTRAYPRDALAPVTMRVRNDRKQPIEIPFGCMRDNPGAQILDGSGAIVYPPAFGPSRGVGPFPPVSCPAPVPPPGPNPIRPGHARTFHGYAVVRGARMNAVVDYLWQPSHGRLQYATVSTTSISLTTTASTPPVTQLHIDKDSSVTALLVHPTPGRHGPLLYQQLEQCTSSQAGGPEEYSSVWTWIPARSDRIRPLCPDPVQWLVVAGYVSQPAVQVEYRQTGAGSGGGP